MAMINQKACNEIACKDLKMLKRNGEISKSTMNKYMEIIGVKSLESGKVIHNVAQAGKRYEKGCQKKLKLLDVTFIPFMLTNETNGTNHWILVEIDMKKKKIITYNPDKLNDSATRELVNTFTEIGSHKEEWIYEISTSTTTQERKTDSGAFVSAWIESIVQNGCVKNCIKPSTVYLYREKIYKKLMIKDNKNSNHTREAEMNLEEVLKYRNGIIQNEEYHGTCGLPRKVLTYQ
jgi:hypothetical protein